jgi:hypothetical protein
MPVLLRRNCLLAMAQCGRWLGSKQLGYADFKLENLVAVEGRPRCVDLVENVSEVATGGAMHTFRMYRLLGRRERPVAEPVSCNAVRATEDTMMFMMACTLLQMVAVDQLVESEGHRESRIFAEGLPPRVHFTAVEARLLNFAFFDPTLRRAMKLAAFEQLLCDPDQALWGAADHAFDPTLKRVNPIP